MLTHYYVLFLGKMILAATTDIYRKAIQKFLPIPSKSHYLFNLRDYSRVIGGIMLVPPNCLKEPDKLIKLWIHEACRVFHDRLVDPEDRLELLNMLKFSCYEHLRQPINKILANLLSEGEENVTYPHLSDLLFGNYMEPDADPKVYDEVSDLEDLNVRVHL